MEAIRCESLCKNFGNLRAVDQLNVSVEQGATFGFLGPNGAGKTTTLRLLTGLTNPTSGQMWVAGEDVSSRPMDLRSKVGYLPESPSFYGWMKGREFLLFTASLYNIDPAKARDRVEQLLDQVDLTDAGGRQIKGYSRGMLQRLGLAQALIHQPQVLFLDEPASALDPMGRRDMLETIAALKGETTVFVSTHILSDVERVCDHVAIINRGKMVASGTIDEIRSSQHGSTFKIEVEEDPAPLASLLGGREWLTSMEGSTQGDRHLFRVEVSDMDRAKKELPRLVYESGLTLLHYELAQASLEDVFVDLVTEGEVGE